MDPPFATLLPARKEWGPSAKSLFPGRSWWAPRWQSDLVQKVKAAMRRDFSVTRYFMNFTAVRVMLRADSASLLEFVGTHIKEIKTSPSLTQR
jgi:hypothetical protein